MVVTTKAAQPSQKAQKMSSYACHIYGLNGHKMTDCPKFVEMLKMFHGKSMIVIKVQHVIKTQIVILDVNVVDVNVTTRNKIIKNKCSRIESQEKQIMLLTGRKKNG
jgi:hypothetical protein